jgi:hypothetical protein
MRFFLFTLTVLSNCVFASCPTDEYVGAFEMGDAPALICIDYESTKCTAKCGQTTAVFAPWFKVSGGRSP